MFGQRNGAVIGFNVFLEKVNVGNVGNQRVKQRAFLGLEDVGNGGRIIDISTEAVNGVGGEGNEFAVFYRLRGKVKVGGGGLIDVSHVRSSKYYRLLFPILNILLALPGLLCQ